MTEISVFLFTLGVAYYLITALQWFNYKFSRIIFHYTKPLWHLYFLLLPMILFILASFVNEIASAAVSGVYLVALFIWQFFLTHSLKFTAKVFRFFIFVFVFGFIFCLLAKLQFAILFVLGALFFAFLATFISEKFIWLHYKKKAKDQLKSMPDLTVILITASFGKTSMKNFLFQILSKNYRTQFTPRSVNTIAGIVQDINENLDPHTQIYIAEAGARQKGDIKAITEFLSPHYVIIGEIGLAHIEYFKKIENTRATKLEALSSKRLVKAYVHSSTFLDESMSVAIYDKNIKDVRSTLDGLSFTIDEVEYSCKLLGGFNAVNLAAVIMLSRALGVRNIQEFVLDVTNVEHRLQRIDANGKIILDDSYNGNFNGMKSSYELAGTYKGRKILLTPGIMEANDEQNEELAMVMDKYFDIIVITSALNATVLRANIKKAEVYILTDKNRMEEFLASHTKSGDLILFSNDAPSFM